MTLTRRQLAEAALAAFASTLVADGGLAGEEPRPSSSPAASSHDMSEMPASWNGKEKIAFLAYPQFTALDLVGPHYMLGNLMGATTYIVAKSREPVVSDMKLAILPTVTFSDRPADLDVICVPGGTTGTLAAMEDAETIAFLKDRGSRARYVSSVCTGSLVLGAAGLLKG
jgi:cyclohexyl-isocyanide hydratase